MKRIYLDWNATAPPHAEVLAAMAAAQEDAWANPASVHGPGRRARARVEEAREEVASLLGFDRRDVVLTSGGTEANNLAILHAFGGGAGSLVVSGIEHPSVARVGELLEARGVRVERAAPDASGVVGVDSVLEAVERARSAAPVRLVSLQAVNQETGVIQPVAAVRAVLDALVPGRSDAAAGSSRILLHVDAVQAVGRVAADAWAGADLVTVAAHKLRGPKGVGALATRPGVGLQPILVGGAQERGLRPGTQDGVAAAGFAAAARRARAMVDAWALLSPMRDAFESAVLAGAPWVARNGTSARAPHVSNLSFDGWSGDELAAALDLEGIACSSGSACSAGTSDVSLVVKAMLGATRAASAVRFSAGEDTLAADLADAARRVLAVLRRTA